MMVVFKTSMETFMADAQRLVWLGRLFDSRGECAKSYLVLSSINDFGLIVRFSFLISENEGLEELRQSSLLENEVEKVKSQLKNGGFEVRGGVLSSESLVLKNFESVENVNNEANLNEWREGNFSLN